MEDINSITSRLESYLQQLSDTTTRWSAWISGNELAAVGGKTDDLKTLEEAAPLLLKECNEVLASRTQLLEDAKAIGLPSSSLQALARSLPAWQSSVLRRSLQIAKNQIAELTRLHMAAWATISQQLQLYRDTMSLLMSGTSERHVYTSNAVPSDSGGQLLDTNL